MTFLLLLESSIAACRPHLSTMSLEEIASLDQVGTRQEGAGKGIGPPGGFVQARMRWPGQEAFLWASHVRSFFSFQISVLRARAVVSNVVWMHEMLSLGHEKETSESIFLSVLGTYIFACFCWGPMKDAHYWHTHKGKMCIVCLNSSSCTWPDTLVKRARTRFHAVWGGHAQNAFAEWGCP